MENKEGFEFTYSAKEQEEIKRIRKKYAAPAEEEDKMVQLRRLDAENTGLLYFRYLITLIIAIVSDVKV